MKKLIAFTTTFIIFFVFVVPAILAYLIDMTPHSEQPGYDGSARVSVYGKFDFKQEFISKEKNLTAIGTSIKNPNLKNIKQIDFNIFDQDNNLLRTVSIFGTNIEDGDFVKFVFEKIPDSENKKYFFTISSPTAGAGEIIEVFIIKPTSEILSFTYNKETKEGGAPLVTFHKPDSRFDTVKRVYSSWLSRLLH